MTARSRQSREPRQSRQSREPRQYPQQYARGRAGSAYAWPSPPLGDRRAPSPVVVHAAQDGYGRRVTLRGRQAGVAHCLADVIELLRLVGVDLDAEEAVTSPLIDWRGGGPDLWWSP